MPRIRKTGAVYPIRHEQRKTLKDGTVKTYVNWQAKVDGRWVSAKTYKECDRKIAEALKEKTEWGMGVDRATRLGEYAERWFELKRRDLKPKSINNYASLISVHLCKYANEKLGEVTASAVQRMIANMRNLDGTPCSYNRQLGFYNILNQIFKAAVADRLIPTSPVTSAARPKRRDTGLAGDRRTINGPVAVSADKRSGTQDRKAFTVEQMQDMLEASSDDLFLGGAPMVASAHRHETGGDTGSHVGRSRPVAGQDVGNPGQRRDMDRHLHSELETGKPRQGAWVRGARQGRKIPVRLQTAFELPPIPVEGAGRIRHDTPVQRVCPDAAEVRERQGRTDNPPVGHRRAPVSGGHGEYHPEPVQPDIQDARGYAVGRVG